VPFVPDTFCAQSLSIVNKRFLTPFCAPAIRTCQSLLNGPIDSEEKLLSMSIEELSPMATKGKKGVKGQKRCQEPFFVSYRQALWKWASS
jgi:hypothetical protein